MTERERERRRERLRKRLRRCVFYELQLVELDKTKKDRDTEIKELWKFLEKRFNCYSFGHKQS